MSHGLLSARAPYNTDIEFYRRNERGLPMPLGQNSPLPDHYETDVHLSRLATPSSDIESKSVSTPRKRVPVACDRCRKRKIKCSGDEGAGRGCSNCRNAGYHGCRFLRVQSVDPELFNMRAAINSRTVWQPSYRYQPYSMSSPHRLNYSSSPSTYGHPVGLPYQTLQPGIDFNSYNVDSQNVQWNRNNSYSVAYPGYDDEVSNSYSAQPPSFILPNTDPMMNSSSCLTGTHSYRPQSHAAWLEPSGQISQQQPTAQVLTSILPLSTSENGLTYQAMNNAPALHVSTERTLPDPSASRFYNSGSISTLESLPLSALTHRSSNGWQTDASSSSSQGSSQTSCSSAGGSGSQEASEERMSAVCNTQNIDFNYLGVRNSPTSTNQATVLPMVVSGTLQPHMSLTTSNNGLGDQRCRARSEDSHHESPSSNSSGYGYAGTNIVSARPKATSVQLATTAYYNRSQPTTSHRDSEVGDGGRECSGCQSGSSRASIASINNMANY